MTLLLGLSLALFIGLVCWWANKNRPLLEPDRELIPNQLLTSCPVIFLSGKKSLFYFLNYWNNLPTRLREHGYEVEEWPLPWRSEAQMQKHLLMRLKQAEKNGQSLHLIADISIEKQIYFLAFLGHPAIQSLNLIGPSGESFNPPSTLKPFATPVMFHELSGLNPLSGWTRYFVTIHAWLNRSANFEPRILGATPDQPRIESFYLRLLTDLAARDLRS